MSALRQIKFTNYKRLERFTLHCSEANILVGPNNAGKSSILDALRVLYGVLRSSRRSKPSRIRSSNGDVLGYTVPDSAIPINIDNVVYNNGNDDARIEFTHQNGSKLFVELHPERLTRVYIDEPPRGANTGRLYFSEFPIDPIIVPTLSPFEISEPYLEDVTVERNRAGRLASRHFRNTWYRRPSEEFDELSQMLGKTWKGINIMPPRRSMPSHSLEMFYREGANPREIAWAGFGFQVWLQILTHMMRGNERSIFVLDEPDVYLHPDLQRKLLHIVRERFDQFFLATHSAEIINHSKPGDIVSVMSTARTAKRVRSDAEYNQVYASIGSIDNVELAKLSRAKRVIFFEGKDKNLLAKFCEKANLTALIDDNETIVIGVGGFGQWRRVVEAAWTFRNVLQVDVKILSVFDRDYRDERDINDIVSQVSSDEVQCIVWGRKEIENYLLSERALIAAVGKRLKARDIDFEESLVRAQVVSVSEKFRGDVHAQIVANTLTYERRINSRQDDSQTVRLCSEAFDVKWNDLESRFSIIPGKQYISDLSSDLQKTYGTTITENMIFEELRASEFAPELVTVLQTIEDFCRAD